MADVEAHAYRVGSRAASIVGIAEALLERDALDEEAVTRVRAIRDLALEMVREAESRETPDAPPVAPQP
jgi:phosphate uptake regulator